MKTADEIAVERGKVAYEAWAAARGWKDPTPASGHARRMLEWHHLSVREQLEWVAAAQAVAIWETEKIREVFELRVKIPEIGPIAIPGPHCDER